MISNDFDGYIEKYIEGYLFSDLNSISRDIQKDKHPGNAAYLMMLSICSGIEFMGVLLKENSSRVEGDLIDTSGAFGHYCKHYLSLIDPNYKIFCELGRELIRNGIVHSFATKGKVGITRLGARDESHLVRYTKDGIIVINPEYLLEDFYESYIKYVKPRIEKGGDLYERANGNYETMRTEYIFQVDKVMQEASKKLDKLPWHHRDIDATSETIEILEVNGYFPVVS